MWEIRKVWVVQIEVGAIAYVGENEQRARSIAGKNRVGERTDPLGFGQPPGSRIETWMVAVRFEGGKAVETQGLAQCPPPEFGDLLAGAEIDIKESA